MKSVTIVQMMDSDTFDRVMDDVMDQKEIYTIYEDKTYEREIAMLMPYKENENGQRETSVST
jgi:hypothetical protein